MNIVSVPKYIRKCEVEIRFRRTGAMGTELFYALKGSKITHATIPASFSLQKQSSLQELISSHSNDHQTPV